MKDERSSVPPSGSQEGTPPEPQELTARRRFLVRASVTLCGCAGAKIGRAHV